MQDAVELRRHEKGPWETDHIWLEKYHAGSYNSHKWQAFETETIVTVFCFMKQEGRNGKEK